MVRPNAARFPALSQELVRDFPLAMAAKEQQDAPQARRALQPQAAHQKVVIQTHPQGAAQLARVVDHPARHSVAPPVTADESVPVPKAEPPA